MSKVSHAAPFSPRKRKRSSQPVKAIAVEAKEQVHKGAEKVKEGMDLPFKEMQNLPPDDISRFVTGVIAAAPDCDAVYRKALEAGGTSVQEPKTQFYGDRHAAVKDPCGNTWWPATHVEDVPPQELEKRAADAARQRQAQAN